MLLRLGMDPSVTELGEEVEPETKQTRPKILSDREISTRGQFRTRTFLVENRNNYRSPVFASERFICGTGLPLARTRWVQSTVSSNCPLCSNQRY